MVRQDENTNAKERLIKREKRKKKDVVMNCRLGAPMFSLIRLLLGDLISLAEPSAAVLFSGQASPVRFFSPRQAPLFPQRSSCSSQLAARCWIPHRLNPKRQEPFHFSVSPLCLSVSFSHSVSLSRGSFHYQHFYTIQQLFFFLKCLFPFSIGGSSWLLDPPSSTVRILSLIQLRHVSWIDSGISWIDALIRGLITTCAGLVFSSTYSSAQSTSLQWIPARSDQG